MNRRSRPRSTWAILLLAVVILAAQWPAAAAPAAPVASTLAAENTSRTNRAFSYTNDKIPEGPWSVHLVKIDRQNPDYELHTTLGAGQITGMTTLTEQVKALPPALGRPMAAINGDFYLTSPRAYNGDPQGLQILDGELVSGPVADYPCFWIDAQGRPQTGIVQPVFRVTWKHGTTTVFGLNEERHDDGATLYTPRMGPSTGTKNGGREIILEAADTSVTNAFLPLRPGVKVRAKVRAIRDAGDTPLTPGIMVISLGPRLLVDAPVVDVGDIIELSTSTVPDLEGCQTALGGGPRLVMDGKPVGGWRNPHQRHPRTALGWNKDHLWLMLVDGRQPGLSVGMSFTEMADYFIKLGCTHALNLDGGGSASMWLLGQTVSSPSEGKERPVANGLVLIKKPKRVESESVGAPNSNSAR